MSVPNKRFIVLTGLPGVGKTTIVKRLLSKLSNDGHNKIKGFYTEEIRENGVRSGFDIVTVNNTRAPLARVNVSIHGPKVGKYTVDVKSLDTISSSLRTDIDSKTLLVIDEIGKMEMFSNIFKKEISEVLSQHQFILATIPVEKGAPVPLLTAIRSSPLTQLFTVTKTNRDHIYEEILQFLEETTRNIQQGP